MAVANLDAKSFLEQVRTHIAAEGRLRASGIRFWEEASDHPPGADDYNKIWMALETERTDIQRRDMVDYRPIFERGLTGLIVGSHTQNRWSLWALIEARGDTLLLDELRLATQDDLEKRDGWADVQVLASDVERLWPTQKRIVAKPPSDFEIETAIRVKEAKLGRPPTDKEAWEAVEMLPAIRRSNVRPIWRKLYSIRKPGRRRVIAP